MKAVFEYRRKFPEVKIELDFSDRRLDLISEGFDIAFRPGLLPDSTLTAKHVGRARRILVAAPKLPRGQASTATSQGFTKPSLPDLHFFVR